nr:hypothetical protein [Kutzneria buriramensis]WKX11055.1 hypothetical protein Q4V64_27520 [Kutzneria buriramensis]
MSGALALATAVLAATLLRHIPAIGAVAPAETATGTATATGKGTESGTATATGTESETAAAAEILLAPGSRGEDRSEERTYAVGQDR